MKNHWCLIRYLWEKPLMSYKNTISMGKTSRCHIKIRYIYGQNHWCHIKIRYICEKQVDVIEKYDIYWAKPLMSYQIRYLREKPSVSYKYLCEKPLMSYKNTISMGKTSRCHVKIRYLWWKQVYVIPKSDIYGENK